MRALLLLAGLSLAALGCDAAPGPGGAERPEGWQSLEGEGSATRLYYQFVGAEGQVRFVERLEDVPEPLRAGVGFVKLDVPPPLSPGDAARARSQLAAGGRARARASAGAGGAARIVLYSAEWCAACHKARRHLDRRGIEYEVRDVDLPVFAEELKRKTGARAVPVIEVDGRMLTGFTPASYDALIGDA